MHHLIFEVTFIFGEIIGAINKLFHPLYCKDAFVQIDHYAAGPIHLIKSKSKFSSVQGQ